MRKALIGLAVSAAVALSGNCGEKDDPLLLLPLGMAAQSSAAPAVPQEDLTPVAGNNSGSGTVAAVGGASATPTPTPTPSSGSAGGGSSGGVSGAGSSGSAGGEASGSSGAGGSGSSGSEAGSSSAGSSGGSSTGSSGAEGSGSAEGGSSGAGGGSTGGSGPTTPAPSFHTSASFTGKDYSSVEGKWYLDGTTLFTYDKINSVGFTLDNMQSGTYRVTIEGKQWVKHDTEQGLPAGFKSFQLMVGASGTAAASLKASSTEYNTVTVDVVIPEGKSVLLVSWLNAVCGIETASSASTDSKSKDSKSKDSKSKDSKSKDSKSKDKKATDSKSKDKKATDSKSKDKKATDNKSKEDGNVSVCHVPPGNPENKHTITVASNAVQAHLAHGDSEGGCAVCANFGVRTVKLERLGGTGISAYIAGAVNNRNLLVAAIIVMVAAAGIAGLRLLADRKTDA